MSFLVGLIKKKIILLTFVTILTEGKHFDFFKKQFQKTKNS